MSLTLLREIEYGENQRVFACDASIAEYIDPGFVPDIKVHGGSYLGQLSQARGSAHTAVEAISGIDVPEAAFKESYLRNYEERMELKKFARTSLRDLNKEVKEEIYYGGIPENPSQGVTDTFYRFASRAFRHHVNTAMGSVKQELGLSIQNHLERVPNVRAKGVGVNGYDCALYAFAATTLGILHAPQELDLSQVRISRTKAGRAQPFAQFDLSWLLENLATESATRKLQHTVRNRTIVGADFTEIESKYITPVKSRLSAARFLLNTTLTSSTNPLANHVVSVTAADGKHVVVMDPKHAGEVSLPRAEFFDRWIPTNMQAHLTIAIPHSREAADDQAC